MYVQNEEYLELGQKDASNISLRILSPGNYYKHRNVAREFYFIKV
jgi:hypothetical protein